MRITATIALTLVFAASVFSQTSLKVGAPAPVFSAIGLDGNDYSLSELRGTVVVLTFWSTKCAICRAEFPKINRLIQGLDGKKVVFLSLTMEDPARVEAYLRSNPLQAHVLTDSFGVVLQYADRDKNGNIDMGFPSFFLLDRSGNLAYRSSGWDKTAELDAHISRLLTSQ